MIKQVLKYGGMFIFLILIQVLILNNIHLGHLITPFFYFLFILLLPFETPRYLQLLLAFFLGLTIDMFTDTAGTHAFACVLAAYARPSILGFLASRDTYESGSLPRISTLGQSWFLRYALLMVLIHHFALFYLEVFSFSGFFGTFLRALVSSFFTIILILLSQYVIYRD